MDIGPRLRAARRARGISVRALAQQTGFSPSFLSQVELGQSSPSLASLQRICEALEVDLPDLLRDDVRPRATAPVVRRADRKPLRSEWSKATAESLVPAGADQRLSVLLLTLDPGGRTGPWASQPGGPQLAYCARGKVRLEVGERAYELASGDSVLLDDAAASWENPGRTKAEVVLVALREKTGSQR